jgi:hypothetical protein
VKDKCKWTVLRQNYRTASPRRFADNNKRTCGIAFDTNLQFGFHKLMGTLRLKKSVLQVVKCTKRKPVFVGVAALLIVLLICIAVPCLRPTTPESRFRELFTDLSVGVPKYQKLLRFSQPVDALKGDFCSADFSQSQPQFSEFLSRLGTSEASVLTSSGARVSVKSKMDPKYPWMLLVQADSTNTPDRVYRVHIEGRQPYD